MNKEVINSLQFLAKQYGIICRVFEKKNMIILTLGYTDAPENFLQFDEEDLPEIAIEVVRITGIKPVLKTVKDYKYTLKRLYVDFN